ncbi:MAG: hypothetical protein R2733_17605 [Acidimicrobiales bacterium]
MSYDLTLLDLPAELFSLRLNKVATGICCEQWVRFEMLVACVDESFAQRPRWDQ